MTILARFSSLAHLFKSNESGYMPAGQRPQARTTTSDNSKFLSYCYSSTESYLSPRPLFFQIITLQSIYYGIGFILILFTCIVSGTPPFSLRLVFSWSPVRSDTTLGWTLFLLWLFDTFFSVVALTVVVGRSKLALDFTLTLHGINLVVCWIVDGKFPASGLWWALQFTSIILMVSLGTWTSQWRELRVTFFNNALDAGHVSRGQQHSGDQQEQQYFGGDEGDLSVLSGNSSVGYNGYEMNEFNTGRPSTSSIQSQASAILKEEEEEDSNKHSIPKPITSNNNSNRKDKGKTKSIDNTSILNPPTNENITKGSKGSRIADIDYEKDDEEDEDDGDLSSLLNK